jgi:hypothetical protein
MVKKGILIQQQTTKNNKVTIGRKYDYYCCSIQRSAILYCEWKRILVNCFEFYYSYTYIEKSHHE